jgi:hypothetical protein
MSSRHTVGGAALARPADNHDRLRVAILFVAPIVLLAGILVHPYVGTYLEMHVVADAVTRAPEMWVASHLIIPVGMSLVLLGVVVIRGEFHRSGEDRWSLFAVPLLYVGGAVWAAIAALEITYGAVAHSGGDVLTVM